MAGKNAHGLLGGHVETELANWARAEATRRGITLTDFLTLALSTFRREHAGADDERVPRAG